MFNKLPTNKRIFAALSIAIVGLTVVHLLLQYLNLNVFEEKQGAVFELSNRFDMDDESSLPTWFSQFLMLALAGLAGLAGWMEKGRPSRRLWQLLALLALVFSIDEVATFHEYILQTLHTRAFEDAGSTLLANAWLIVTPIILVALALLARWVYRALPRSTFNLLFVGGLLFFTGSIAVDWLANAVDPATFLSQGVLVAVEESLEFLGLTLAIYAATDYLENEHGARIKSALKELRR